jgi:hypothetical protein
MELSNHLRVTLPIVLSFIGLAAMGTMEWASLRGDVSDLKKSQWTVTDQLQWTLEFKSSNPGIVVPIPTIRGVPSTFDALSKINTNSVASTSRP